MMSSKLVKQLSDVLNDARGSPLVNGTRLHASRLAVRKTDLISLGLKNNVGGSVYTPLPYRRVESGEVFLIWEDGKYSTAKVENTMENSAVTG